MVSEGRARALSRAVPQCWCGNRHLQEYAPDYLRCPACETLVARRMPEPEELISLRDESGFYGREYYERYLVDKYGFPTLAERARNDLSERCLYWLRFLLSYKLPPATALELGSAHGGFVALLRWAGFDATGLEVSQWLVEFATRTFQVPMLLGPIEHHNIAPASLDLIALMDLLEHLPDPVYTLSHCARLLKPEGVLILQTPCYPQGRSLAELEQEQAPFLKMMTAPDHLFLFSQSALRQLLATLDLKYIDFLPPLFPYDMFLVAGRRPLARYSPAQVAECLTHAPSARLVRSLLDLDENVRELTRRYSEAEADRSARLAVIRQQAQQIAELAAARDQASEQLHQVRAQLAAAEADRAARLDAIRVLEQRLRDADHTVADLHHRLADLHERLGAAEADRAARLLVIERQGRQLGELEAARKQTELELHQTRMRLAAAEAEREAVRETLGQAQQRLRETQRTLGELRQETTELREALSAAQAVRESLQRQAEDLDQRLKLVETERSGLAQQLQQLGESLAASQAERNRLAEQARRLQESLEAAQTERALAQEAVRGAKAELQFLRAVLDRFSQSLVYRAMRAAHLWDWLAVAVERRSGKELNSSKRAPGTGRLERIVVDLTPLLPGGENGGAKLLALELVKQLSRLAPQCRFLLLTLPRCHDELARLESRNVQRICLADRSVSRCRRALAWLISAIEPALRRLAPSSVARLSQNLRQALANASSDGLLQRLKADLLFCPFTAPFFYEPGIPVVSVIYDLQYLDYPQFFDEEERASRDRAFRQACLLSSRLVCISDFVRQRVLREGLIPPERVHTVHITAPNRLPRPSQKAMLAALKRRQLDYNGYLLYPANFWPHKNHELLLTAFGMYRARRPQSHLRLVLTGAPGPRMEFLRAAAARMNLSEYVIFAGFLPDEEFAALLYGCRALIFPSLYEGFGMPVLEAMAAGKPVLASNLTSMPEMTGTAAALFDPLRPEEIVQAIERVETDEAWVAELIRRGRARAAELGNEQAMAGKYWQLFSEAAAQPVAFRTALHGVYPDGWTGRRVVLIFDDGPHGRRLSLTVRAPGWLPGAGVTLEVPETLPGGANGRAPFYVPRGETRTVECPLPAGAGSLEIAVEPVFQPRAMGLGRDSRWLGCRILSAQLRYPDGSSRTPEFVAHGL